MGDVCYSWTYRPIGLPTLIILATLTCVVQCSQSPAALVRRSYPRGNHWAVGHFMGRKSVEMLPEPQLGEQEDVDYQLTSLEPRDTPLDQQYPSKPDRALFGSGQRQTDRRFLEKTRWREEVGYKYLREMPDLLLLGLKLKNEASS